MSERRTVTFEIPDSLDDMVIKQGVCVISGWNEKNGDPLFQILTLDDTPSWIAGGLFRYGAMASDGRFMSGWNPGG